MLRRTNGKPQKSFSFLDLVAADCVLLYDTMSWYTQANDDETCSVHLINDEQFTQKLVVVWICPRPNSYEKFILQ